MKNFYIKLNNLLNGIIDKITLFLFRTILPDYIKHLVLLFCISTGLFLLFFIIFSLTNSVLFAIIVSEVIIFTREKLDKKYTTGFSKKDIFYGQIGIFLSVLLIIVISEII